MTKLRQTVIKGRTKTQSTPKLFDLILKLSSQNDNDIANSSGGTARQRIIKTRTRSDGKATGIARRKF